MLTSLKWMGLRPLLAAALGFAGGYQVHAGAPEPLPRERFGVLVPVQAPALMQGGVAGSALPTGELSGVQPAAAMSSGVVLGGELLQPLPP